MNVYDLRQAEVVKIMLELILKSDNLKETMRRLLYKPTKVHFNLLNLMSDVYDQRQAEVVKIMLELILKSDNLKETMRRLLYKPTKVHFSSGSPDEYHKV